MHRKKENRRHFCLRCCMLFLFETNRDSLCVKTVDRIDEAYRTCGSAHNDGVRSCAAFEVTDRFKEVTLRDSCTNEECFVAFYHVIDGEDLLHITDAHFFRTFDIVIIFRPEASLHVAAEAFERSCCDNA